MVKTKFKLEDISGCRTKREIAAMYFPGYNDKSSAVIAFHEFIDQNTQMRTKLMKVHYNDNSRFLSPVMLKIIVEYWGLPDTVESYVTSCNCKK